MSIAHFPERAAAATQRPALTVASVPSGHVYVRHLAPLDGRGAVRLPDPDPSRPDRPAGATWWPPVMLDPEWARTADFDVFHLHFGFDAVEPDQLRRLIRVVRGRGKPFVFTVHDLRNPHHTDRALHDDHLDVLVPAADALVTLTPGAADEIESRWGRRPLVVPHPHVVDLPTISRALEVRPRWVHRPFRVGLHLKSLRANMDPMRILPTLVETVAGLDDAVLQVNCHRDILDTDGARRDAELSEWLRTEAADGRLELSVHDYFSDEDLWGYLASLDLSVLPYTFGTHSGWLEACRDLQTTVLAPSCGYYADQGPILSYTNDGDDFDAGSLRDAVTYAYTERPRFGATVDERTEQRRRVAQAHEDLYREVCR
ncbi:glycosyltransferase family 1 protein [Nocardioides KLBMP 9356]|uniref:Glycosyltransferase family 1 protein n=1 Tax=Nocardioides potassii TaxID=2911371 RepID=A0ABS9HA85_9ACTN|nr:glycosyltransferase family 1 protein [Nocardioides potassii]MCF6377409.1 glycosyltransferase family 1 protein [Nocardioides potassii]